MLVYKNVLISLLFLIRPGFSFASGTVVRNGGAPVLHFLEATRFALVETLKDIHLDPKINATFCANEPQLTTIQQQFCRTYLFSILNEMIDLNIDPKKIPFALREDTLLVTGPDGHPMPVSARTELGDAGLIEFNLNSVKLMSPQIIFHLVSHEIQHKVTFKGSNSTDNDPIGPFSNGRDLIDTVASALAKVAIKNGRIGAQFTLRDSFECLIRSGSSEFGLRAATQRWFFDPTLTNYKLSLSALPSDPFISVADTLNSKVVYQLEVADSNHCETPTDKNLRHSKVSLWRVFNDPNMPSVLLTEQKIPGLNPLCEKVSPVFTADYQSIHFECTYYGAAAY